MPLIRNLSHVYIGLLSFSLIFFSACAPRSTSSEAAANRAALNEILNTPVPLVSGRQSALSVFRGKVVMLHFFSSWCGECSLGASSVENVHNSFKDSGFSVVGVAVEDEPFQTQIFAAKNSLQFPIFMDMAGDLKNFFGVKTVPATIFLDRNGTPITFRNPTSGELTAKFDGAMMWDTTKPVEMIAGLVERR